MSIVVDAFVAAKWLLDEPDSERASQLLIEDLFAPTLLRPECASAILKRVRLSQLQETEGRTRLAEIDHLPIRFFPIDEAAAIELAMTLRHPV